LQPVEPGGLLQDDLQQLPPSNGIGDTRQKQQQRTFQEQQHVTVVKATTNRVESLYYTASSQSTRTKRNHPADNQISSSGGKKLFADTANINNNNNNVTRSGVMTGEWESCKNRSSTADQSIENRSSWDSFCGDSGSSVPDHHTAAAAKRTLADGDVHSKTVITNHKPPPPSFGDSTKVIMAGDGGGEGVVGTDDAAAAEDDDNGDGPARRDSLHSVPSRETGAIPKQRRRRKLVSAAVAAHNPVVPHPDEIISLPLDEPSSSLSESSPRNLTANARQQHNTFYNIAH